MYFLFNACNDSTVLSVLYFISLLLDIVFIAIPIGLIVMLLVDFSKSVISGDEQEQIKSTKLVVKRIIYSVIVFIIPWIVSLLMFILDETGVDLGGDYQLCLENVKLLKEGTKDVEYFQQFEQITNEIEENNNAGSGGSSSGGQSSGSSSGGQSSGGSSGGQSSGGSSGGQSSGGSSGGQSSGGSSGGQSSGGSSGGQSSGGSSSNSNFSASADALVNLAKGEEGKTDRTKYGVAENQGWCAAFVQWCLKNTMLSDGSMSIFNYINKDGYVSSPFEASGLQPAFKKSEHLNFYISNYFGGNYVPKKGDIVWFQWDGGHCQTTYEGEWDKVTECSDHTAIVIAVDGENFTTIDGNSGGKVSINNRNINSRNVIAFGSWYE